MSSIGAKLSLSNGCVDFILILEGDDWPYDLSDVEQKVQLWKELLIQLMARMELPSLGMELENVFWFFSI